VNLIPDSRYLIFKNLKDCPKINLEKVTFFGAQKPPSKTPQLTSESPQLHHKKPPKNAVEIAKPPLKTPLPPQTKIFH
jgi:hypothetical protein